MRVADQFLVRQPLSCHLLKSLHEAQGITAFALIEAKRLLVKVSQQVFGFNAYVGTLERTFGQAPKVLKPVGVNPPLNVLDGVIYKTVIVASGQALIRHKRIGVQGGTGFNVFDHFTLKRFAARVLDNLRANLARAAFAAALKDAHDNGLADRAAPLSWFSCPRACSFPCRR